MRYPDADIPHAVLKLPPETKAKLRRLATDQRRTMNAQVSAMVEAAYQEAYGSEPTGDCSELTVKSPRTERSILRARAVEFLNERVAAGLTSQEERDSLVAALSTSGRPSQAVQDLLLRIERGGH